MVSQGSINYCQYSLCNWNALHRGSLSHESVSYISWISSLSSVKHGYADVVVAGGTESCLDPWTFAAFSRMRALATDQDLGFLPHHISRPFDSRRNGFVMSEGAAALVLQAWPPPLHVQSRYSSITGTDVVNPLAEIVGYGRTSK
ncbi:unnamed protein product [Protopolystoma xenopodis]|uniref:beta-ketoacyl-[acyl-carrier-protein] synthase I n=1 Tax=Protopolystoma xenopodis TaxID=117903 RepID=A0A3S5BMW4_9PLAT|nr:unnamed protein product [Protopolystoma xenopodis]